MESCRFLSAASVVLLCWSCAWKEPPQSDVVQKMFNLAETQCTTMIGEIDAAKQNASAMDSVNPLVSPRSVKNGSLLLVKSTDWTSGFFPGMLWMLYEHTGDVKWKNDAIRFTSNIEREQWNGKSHDMGFKIYCSVGNGYRLTGDTTYRNIIIQGAKTLITRFKPAAGILRSWDHHQDKWECPVIIDNMMNLELLFEATKLSGDSAFYNVAVSHARTTMKNHYRPDYSAYHVVDYDTLTGEVIKKDTHQGYALESAWSRGQAWGLYGFAMCFRETGDTSFLKHAEGIAKFILNHPHLPEDKIPYWDFDAPGIPNEPRDVSAAAVLASALYELSTYSNNGPAYREVADTIVSNLSKSYSASPGQDFGYILLHSVGSKPSDSEVDVPLIYADYYFLEALLRKKEPDAKRESALNGSM
jgi:unsaturated chondroitin disaccharide hydrolase